MLGDSLEVLGLQPVFLSSACSDRDPRDPISGVHFQCRQRIAQKMQPSDGQGRIQAAVHLLGLDSGGEKLAGYRKAPGAYVAEPESARVGEHGDVKGARNLRCDVESKRYCDIVNQLSRGARRRIGEHVLRRRLVARDVMVDYQLRDFQLPHRLGKGTEPLHISDVNNYQKVDTAERSGPLSRFIRYIRPQQESEGLGPRCGIDDSGFHSAALEQPRQRCLGAAAVAVSVDVSADCDRAPRAELPREALYRFDSVWRYR